MEWRAKLAKIDLNADIGEGIGDDAGIMRIISAANIACGLHAGSPDLMAQMVALARENAVEIGAHPGFDDRANFGRERMDLPESELRALIQYQIGALQAIARAQGGVVRYVKLHGALGNMAAEDEALAAICYQAALDIDPDIALYTIAETAQTRAARRLTHRVRSEIFADRAYDDRGLLVDRKLLGAVLHDPGEIVTRLRAMIASGSIIAQSGRHIRAPIDTICVHSDTKGALEIATAVRDELVVGNWIKR